MEVGSIPPEDFGRYLISRFAEGGFELSAETLSILLSIGGDSPNDVQHLAHESWNFCSRRHVSAAELQLALARILSDLAPMGDSWLALLTQRQTRALLATAFHEDLGGGTAEFMRAAGARNTGTVASALRPCLQGPDPIVEKVGPRYRVRSRFLRLWLCGRRHLVQELVPSLRADADYRAALHRVCSALAALEPPLLTASPRSVRLRTAWVTDRVVYETCRNPSVYGARWQGRGLEATAVCPHSSGY